MNYQKSPPRAFWLILFIIFSYTSFCQTFKVHLDVSSESNDLLSRYLSESLRSSSDVVLVDKLGQSEYTIEVLQITSYDGLYIASVIVRQLFTEHRFFDYMSMNAEISIIDLNDYVTDFKESYPEIERTVIYMNVGGIMRMSNHFLLTDGDIKSLSERIVAKIDQDEFEPIRRIHEGTRMKYGTPDIPLIDNGNGTFSCEVLVDSKVKANFIFDTGASYVTIGTELYNKLKSEGLLPFNKLIGEQNFQLADGSTTSAFVYQVDEFKIGNKTVNNVKCAVVLNKDSPNLLGQSFLEKLGKFQIDWERKRIVFD